MPSTPEAGAECVSAHARICAEGRWATSAPTATNPPSTTWNAAAWTGSARTAAMASLERSLSQSLPQICTGSAWCCREPSGTRSRISDAKAFAAPPDCGRPSQRRRHAPRPWPGPVLMAEDRRHPRHSRETRPNRSFTAPGAEFRAGRLGRKRCAGFKTRYFGTDTG